MSDLEDASGATTVHHPWLELRKLEKPVKVFDQLSRDTKISRFNSWLALKVTKLVGSMWCAYLFAAFDMLSLPAALHAGIQSIVSWVAQTFLQLVLLSIIMVGQDVQAKAADKRADQTFNDAEALLHETQLLNEHLSRQDAIMAELERKLAAQNDQIAMFLDGPKRDQ
ncbi:MAG: hypothetical protein ACYDHP_12210 [Ferrimicrobium sp.]